MQFFPSLNSNHLRSAHLGVGRLFRGREEAVLHGQVARTLEAKVAFINDRLRQSPQSLSLAQENVRILREKISNPEHRHEPRRVVLFLRPTCSTSCVKGNHALTSETPPISSRRRSSATSPAFIATWIRGSIMRASEEVVVDNTTPS